MSENYKQIRTITCDRCGMIREYIQDVRLPDPLEADLFSRFIVSLKREGWITVRANGNHLCPLCTKKITGRV